MFNRMMARWLAPGVLRRVANRPLLVTPDVARDTINFLMERKGMIATFQAFDDAGGSPPTIAADMRYTRKAGKSYHQSGAVAVIPIDGTLVHKNGSIDPECGMTGYDGVAAKLQAALNDPEIKGILLDINSPGGEVDGVADLASQIAASTKTVWALADASAYSAAYWLASQADKLFLSPNSGVGSVGVVMAHADYSGALADEGVKVTLIHAGAHKVDGNPYEPLPTAVQAQFQKECDDLRMTFAQAVASGRGISVDAVLATEARCLTASDAVAAGFADGVMPSYAVVQKFMETINGAAQAMPVIPAAVTTSAAAPQPKEDIDMSKEPGAAAPADTTAATQKAITDAVAANQARISAIMGHAEAKGREAMAQHLALNTDMSVEAAAETLKLSPKGSALALSMAQVGDAKVEEVGELPKPGSRGVKIDTNAIYVGRAKTMGQAA